MPTPNQEIDAFIKRVEQLKKQRQAVRSDITSWSLFLRSKKHGLTKAEEKKLKTALASARASTRVASKQKSSDKAS